MPTTKMNPPYFPELYEVILAEIRQRLRDAKTPEELGALVRELRPILEATEPLPVPSPRKKHGSGEYARADASGDSPPEPTPPDHLPPRSYRAAIEIALRLRGNKPHTTDELFEAVRQVMPEAKLGSLRPEISRQAGNPLGILRRDAQGKYSLKPKR